MPEQQKTILLVEDDQFIRELCYNAINRDETLKNVKVETAETGNLAIKKLNALSSKLSLVLLDIILPDKNGYEILEFMKNDNSLKNIPVVVLSNLGQDEEIQKAKALGARDFMIKAQSDIDEIVAKIKQYLI
ncbi:response regulator [bacterium]|jgi:putative two-component system response regulator|nr:response regulator [bacterium]MDP6571662.1 response regulator [Patescibacteria group bacterium]|tara:strand:+ start:4342 stop:4737 length:396 start_codon:yes stop_codon:yes gene_type:complete